MTKSRDLGDLAQTVAVNLPTALGTAGQTLVVNSGADGLEFGAASGGSGVTTYTGKSGTDGTPAGATYIDNVSSPSEGDLAYDLAADQLYIRTTSDWKRVALGVDESPIVTTEPVTSLSLNKDGSTSTVTMVATDPEGFGITYGIAYPTAGNALPDQLATATSINQSTGVFTFDPSTDTNDAGTVKVRLSASDGARTTTRLCELSLSFAPETIEYLMVAGGGGGGWSRGGGGGAGGLLASSSYSISNSSITVSVGAGGQGGTGANNQANGSNTTLDSLTAIGGGKGASSNLANGGNGGSGGGAVASGTAGTGTTGQGTAGGSGSGSTTRGGGGGGAGQSGRSQAQGSAGGYGVSNSITGSAVTYAGGGGGGVSDGSGAAGAGGSGGGGAGGGNPGSAGTDGLGGGGGGGGRGNGEYNGGAGGDGVIIIAYPETDGGVPTFSSGLTYTSLTSRSGYRVYKITAGSGTVSW